MISKHRELTTERASGIGAIRVIIAIALSHAKYILHSEVIASNVDTVMINDVDGFKRKERERER